MSGGQSFCIVLYGTMWKPLINNTLSLNSWSLSICLSTFILMSSCRSSSWDISNVFRWSVDCAVSAEFSPAVPPLVLSTSSLPVAYHGCNVGGCSCDGIGLAALGLGRHGGMISGAVCLVGTHCEFMC